MKRTIDKVNQDPEVLSRADKNVGLSVWSVPGRCRTARRCETKYSPGLNERLLEKLDFSAEGREAAGGQSSGQAYQKERELTPNNKSIHTLSRRISSDPTRRIPTDVIHRHA